jgi:hypothetical protein
MVMVNGGAEHRFSVRTCMLFFFSIGGSCGTCLDISSKSRPTEPVKIQKRAINFSFLLWHQTALSKMFSKSVKVSKFFYFILLGFLGFLASHILRGWVISFRTAWGATFCLSLSNSPRVVHRPLSSLLGGGELGT